MYEICTDVLIGTTDSLYASFQFTPFDAESELRDCLGAPTGEVDLLGSVHEARDGDGDSEDELRELHIRPPPQLAAVSDTIHIRAPPCDPPQSSPQQRVTATAPTRPVLIEDLSKPPVQQVERAVITCDEREGRLRVQIAMPETRCAMRDLQLDVSSQGLVLEIAVDKSFEPLRVEFGEAISVDSAVAKLHRRDNRLVITARLARCVER